ncbi:unnamed protein product, partial [Prorocentrum cordatum]
LPVGLVARVFGVYWKSRVVFRTAPAVYKTKWIENDSDIAASSAGGVRTMRRELRKHVRHGKLYGEYELIEYSKIMDDLIQERGFVDPSLWLKDGYHPSADPSRRYLDAIFRLLNVTTVEEKAQVNDSKRLTSALAGDEDE